MEVSYVAKYSLRPDWSGHTDQRMIEDAEKKGANAIVSMRFSTSMIMQNAAEVLAYGTGVVLE